MGNPFTDHPQSLGETYSEHGKQALIFSFNLTLAGIACFIHAIFPFLFQKTASKLMIKMTNVYVSRLNQVDNNIAELSECIEKKIMECQNKRA